MKTEVTMIRFLGQDTIRQKSKSGMFNATDLLKSINKRRINDDLNVALIGNYLKMNSTQEFLEVLSEEKDILVEDLIVVNKKAGTWVHPYVLMDIALWAYPALKVKIYDWIHDELLRNRNMSGDSFKKMNLVLDDKFSIGGRGWLYAGVAEIIADEVGVAKGNSRWQEATEEQLEMRNSLQREVMSSAIYGKHKSLDECVKEAINIWRKFK